MENLNDSAYLIEIKVGNTEECVQVFCYDKEEMQRVVARVATSPDLVVTVQGMGAVMVADEYLDLLDEEGPEEGMNFGGTN